MPKVGPFAGVTVVAQDLRPTGLRSGSAPVLGRRTLLGTGAVVALCPRLAWAHPEPVSFSELHHRPDRAVVECSLRVKAEDLEHVIGVMSGLPLRFGGKGFSAWIVAYLRRVMLLRGPKGEHLLPLSWVGSEVQGAFVWLYIRMPTVQRPGDKELSDALVGYHLSQGYLLGVVPYQVNTVVLHRGKHKDTLHYQEDSPRFLQIKPI